VTAPIGAIVAGGEAMRFGGAPKGLRRVGGDRIIDRVAAALGATTSELIIVSNAPEATHWIPAFPHMATYDPNAAAWSAFTRR